MSRLKDALDRAAHSNPDQSRSAFSPPAHVVPEAWPFEYGDEAAAIVGSAPLRNERDEPNAAESIEAAAAFSPEETEAAVTAAADESAESRPNLLASLGGA